MSSPSVQAEDAYFSSNPPPRHLGAHLAQASSFIAEHAAAGRRVVLITSGGTTVPLERQTVRFIDNFSAGTRGATSAEYFLAAGYAVLFLHREFSLQPYSRHYTHAKDCFLDFLDEDAGAGGEGDRRVVVRHKDQARILDVLREYKKARRSNMLLMLPFVTIGDYLHELRGIARLMRPLGSNGLLYLAAAVSDFFVPPERMAEHKIQSTDAAQAPPPPTPLADQPGGGTPSDDEQPAFDNFDAPRVPRSKRLVVDLDPVPKFLENLVDGWAPEGMIVSYKLETDPALLVRKARASLDRYQHHLVIGNLLATRKWEVVFVNPGRPGESWVRVGRKGGWGEAEGRPLRADEVPPEEPEAEIEALIIPAVAELHDEHIASKKA
ncbi:DNA/pantothenate metabolism flavoprotein [Cordyceps fumosorosea ARSEF 2679]|uniref:DNA/pantothenate metabolism flavoprotein n=1 Tax=Cordyceps fumosorosea (strain ARSEF 2679) TaxID=1081104 RepID=A0A167NM27_CORFA|nr:DNA/pantothenate metabolism flavoprotein [Cordyceps fumosorosea ARSEF 2679]OAA55704.1 DNA/pantothenate metabolism flavoprotein [Cordyceps fumosorosea ARSEF 2679]